MQLPDFPAKPKGSILRERRVSGGVILYWNWEDRMSTGQWFYECLLFPGFFWLIGVVGGAFVLQDAVNQPIELHSLSGMEAYGPLVRGLKVLFFFSGWILMGLLAVVLTGLTMTARQPKSLLILDSCIYFEHGPFRLGRAPDRSLPSPRGFFSRRIIQGSRTTLKREELSVFVMDERDTDPTLYALFIDEEIRPVGAYGFPAVSSASTDQVPHGRGIPGGRSDLLHEPFIQSPATVQSPLDPGRLDRSADPADDKRDPAFEGVSRRVPIGLDLDFQDRVWLLGVLEEWRSQGSENTIPSSRYDAEK